VSRVKRVTGRDITDRAWGIPLAQSLAILLKVAQGPTSPRRSLQESYFTPG